MLTGYRHHVRGSVFRLLLLCARATLAIGIWLFSISAIDTGIIVTCLMVLYTTLAGIDQSMDRMKGEGWNYCCDDVA